MIPKEHETQIVQAGLGFIRAVTEAYGNEEGIKVWDSINQHLDPDIKGKVFFAMVTGHYNDVIKLTGTYDYRDKVKLIKCIRSWTGVGLKEAKDIADALDNRQPQFIKVDPKYRNAAMSELREAGAWM